jgi:hypothetical protein
VALRRVAPCGSVHCAMYREPFSAGVTRAPGAFLLARPGRCEETGACLKPPWLLEEFRFRSITQKAHDTNATATPSCVCKVCKDVDAGLISISVSPPVIPVLASSTPPTSFLILTTFDHSATKLPLYFLQLSLRDTSYYLPLQASQSYPPIAAYNSTSY